MQKLTYIRIQVRSEFLESKENHEKPSKVRNFFVSEVRSAENEEEKKKIIKYQGVARILKNFRIIFKSSKISAKFQQNFIEI